MKELFLLKQRRLERRNQSNSSCAQLDAADKNDTVQFETANEAGMIGFDNPGSSSYEDMYTPLEAEEPSYHEENSNTEGDDDESQVKFDVKDDLIFSQLPSYPSLDSYTKEYKQTKHQESPVFLSGVLDTKADYPFEFEKGEGDIFFSNEVPENTTSIPISHYEFVEEEESNIQDYIDPNDSRHSDEMFSNENIISDKDDLYDEKLLKNIMAIDNNLFITEPDKLDDSQFYVSDIHPESTEFILDALDRDIFFTEQLEDSYETLQLSPENLDKLKRLKNIFFTIPIDVILFALQQNNFDESLSSRDLINTVKLVKLFYQKNEEKTQPKSPQPSKIVQPTQHSVTSSTTKKKTRNSESDVFDRYIDKEKTEVVNDEWLIFTNIKKHRHGLTKEEYDKDLKEAPRQSKVIQRKREKPRVSTDTASLSVKEVNKDDDDLLYSEKLSTDNLDLSKVTQSKENIYYRIIEGGEEEKIVVIGDNETLFIKNDKTGHIRAEVGPQRLRLRKTEDIVKPKISEELSLSAFSVMKNTSV
eukprot:TRINITY_DN8954_c0_g1_i1.p1 TRINITY_DN8954_c0_g1~~TRINITY_DN8954_c0_g1_i1.p1  ORF type:complete len:530 (+),score=101.01 TRINITY_DN8954_c0_g1_i1:195-1784(+)